MVAKLINLAALRLRNLGRFRRIVLTDDWRYRLADKICELLFIEQAREVNLRANRL